MIVALTFIVHKVAEIDYTKYVLLGMCGMGYYTYLRE